MKDITFDHSADTFTKALGLAEGEAEKQLEKLSEVADKAQEKEGGMNRSKLAELVLANLDKEVILLFATEYVIEQFTENSMEQMVKQLKQLRDALKD